MQIVSPAPTFRSTAAASEPEGRHEAVWDGRDDQGAQVPNGEYPYRLVAQVDGATVYDSSLVLRIQCNVASDERTWGALKSLYRP